MVGMSPSELEVPTDAGARLHIAPSELNTPTPNNGSNSFLVTTPRVD